MLPSTPFHPQLSIMKHLSQQLIATFNKFWFSRIKIYPSKTLDHLEIHEVFNASQEKRIIWCNRNRTLAIRKKRTNQNKCQCLIIKCGCEWKVWYKLCSKLSQYNEIELIYILNKHTNGCNPNRSQLVNAQIRSWWLCKKNNNVLFKSISNQLIKGIHLSVQYIRIEMNLFSMLHIYSWFESNFRGNIYGPGGHIIIWDPTYCFYLP